MSERLTAPQHETLKPHDLGEQAKKHLDELKAEAEKHGESTHNVEHLAHRSKEEAVSTDQYAVGEREATPATHSFGTHKELKTQSYKRTLAHVRTRLHGPEKTFSKVIHNKTVERVSNVGAQTVARPTSLLFAGLFASGGSLILLLMAKRYGFTYNFSVLLFLILGGYAFGLVIELLGKALKRR